MTAMKDQKQIMEISQKLDGTFDEIILEKNKKITMEEIKEFDSMEDELKITDLDCGENCGRKAEMFSKDKNPICAMCFYKGGETKEERKPRLTERFILKNENKIKENYRQLGKNLKESKKEKIETTQTFQQAAMDYFKNKRQGRVQASPKSVSYEKYAPVFWQFYADIVEEETGIKKPIFPKEEKVGNLRWFWKRYLKWMIGETSEKYYDGKNDGLFDPSKSLYIVGESGIGKSSIVEAGHYLLDFIKNQTQWNDRVYRFISMDEVYFDSYTDETLKGMRSLTKGGICIDDLKKKHMHYKHFGKDLKPVNDILFNRHLLWKQKKINTIITANMSPKILKEELDDQILFNRIVQQYQIIELKGQDFRKT